MKNTTDNARFGSTSTALLLVSAFLIGAMVIMQAGRMPAHPAYAGDAVVGAEVPITLTVGGEEIRVAWYHSVPRACFPRGHGANRGESSVLHQRWCSAFSFD